MLAVHYFQFAVQLSVIYATRSLDLDYILVEGDKLYKLLKCRDYLKVTCRVRVAYLKG